MAISADLLEAVQNVLGGLEFDRSRLLAACSPELLATARAMKRVRDGVPFREAYRQAADDSDLFDESLDASLDAYASLGYPGRVDIESLRDRLKRHERWMSPPGAGEST